LKVFSKKGCKGDTSLLFSQRVPESDLRCETYGTIDEAISSLDVSRAIVRRAERRVVMLQEKGEIVKRQFSNT